MPRKTNREHDHAASFSGIDADAHRDGRAGWLRHGRQSQRSAGRIQPRHVRLQPERRRWRPEAGGHRLQGGDARLCTHRCDQFLFQPRRYLDRHQQRAAGQDRRRRERLRPFPDEYHRRHPRPVRRGEQRRPGEAQRGLRPDPRPLGCRQRRLFRAAHSWTEHHTRRHRSTGARLARRSVVVCP